MQTPQFISGTFTSYDNSTPISSADINMTLNGVTKTVVTDSSGYYQYSLMEWGSWSKGDVITIQGKNNLIFSDIYDLVITDEVEMTQNLLYKYHKIPVQDMKRRSYDPLADANKIINVDANGNPVFPSFDFDLINNPSRSIELRSDGQPTSITLTIENGNSYKKTFTYNANSFNTGESKWIRQ